MLQKVQVHFKLSITQVEYNYHLVGGNSWELQIAAPLKVSFGIALAQLIAAPLTCNPQAMGRSQP